MTRPPHDDSRCLIARALIDILRIAALHDEKAGGGGPAPHVEQLLLLWTIYVGQCEGRLFSASKLEHYTGMPRVTVMRKLAPLIEAGKVSRRSRGYCLTDEWLDDPQLDKLINKVSAIFQIVGAQLTILDNRALDDAGGF